jgi:hypothetical protein
VLAVVAHRGDGQAVVGGHQLGDGLLDLADEHDLVVELVGHGALAVGLPHAVGDRLALDPGGAAERAALGHGDVVRTAHVGGRDADLRLGARGDLVGDLGGVQHLAAEHHQGAAGQAEHGQPAGDPGDQAGAAPAARRWAVGREGGRRGVGGRGGVGRRGVGGGQLLGHGELLGRGLRPRCRGALEVH